MKQLLILAIVLAAAMTLDLSEEEEAFLSFPEELQTLIEEAEGNGTGDTIASYARQKIGKPYEYGAQGPDKFDCSGLSLWCHKQVGINIQRTASAQGAAGKVIAKADLRPGDLVFFDTMDTGSIGHVVIYVGGGNIVHAPKPGDYVKEVSMNNSYWNPRFKTARRYW